MANDKKFIAKNGLLTPQNAVIGSTSDTGEKLQVTGSTKLAGQVNVTANDFSNPALSVTNSAGYLFAPIVAEFAGDSDSLQIINSGVGDYKLVNSQQNNGIIFYDSTPGVRIIYNNSPRLDINSDGNKFYGLATTTIDGNRILTTADEGSGNGLDADTIDGLDSLQFVRADVDDTMDGTYTVTGDFTVSGNLTVSGTTTTVNTEEILLADNIITLNSNYTGSTPSENAGIEIERGTLNNPKILWDESNDYWKLVNGSLTDLGRIITTADEGSGNGFDADTVDGLEASQFLRSDVDDTAAGNITIQGDLTIGDNVGGAQIIFDGANNNRTLYSESGVIGFLNQAFNYSARSDASGNWIVEKDVVAGEDVFAVTNVIAGGSVTANTGSVSAATSVTAGTDVTAQNNITATTGNITATAGAVSAGTTVTAGTDVIGQRFVDADNNAYIVNPAGTSTMNDIGIDDDLFHNGDTNTKLSFSTDDISLQTGGAERLGIDNDSVDSTVTFTAPNIGVGDDIFHNGDTDTKINFTTDTIKINTGGATRLTANTTGIHVTNLTASGNITGSNISATTEIESPIYYDRDDRNYYGDFASTSRLNDISLVGQIIHDGDTNTYLDFSAADTFDVVTGGTTRLTVNNTSVTGSVDFVAPRFVDADNNSYYLDPSNATLSLNANGELRTDYSVAVTAVDGAGNITPGSDEVRLSGYGIIGNRGTVYITNAGGDVQIGNGGTHNADPGLTVSSTRTTSLNNVYAPVYYDSNDENYYGNFAGASRVNDVNLVGQIIHDGDTNTYLDFNAADSFQIVAGGTGIFTATSTTVTVDGDLTVTGTITGVDADFSGDITAVNGTFSGDLSANNVTATTAMYAPRYYDADNSTYYGDFASTSILNRVGIDDYIQHNGETSSYFGFSAANTYVVATNNTVQLTVDTTYLTSTLDGIFPNLFAFRYYDAENATYYTEPAATSRMNDISLVGEIIHDGDTNTYLEFNAADSFRVVTGGAQRLLVNNTYVLANNQMRSPIYYDSNDTNYYGNFASTSQMNRIDIDDYIRHRGDTDTYMGFDAADQWGVWTGGTKRLSANTTVVSSSVDFRAPRFVDSDNTSYYLDPANASLSATLNGAVRIGSITNNSRWSDNSGNGGIALIGYADDTASNNPAAAISGNYSGGYALLYLNRIDPNPNPFQNGNRYIEFRHDGTVGSSIRGDSSGNLYNILASGTHWGFWTPNGDALIVANEDGNVIVGDSSATYTVSDNTSVIDGPTPGTPRVISNNKFHVGGSIQLNGAEDAIVFGTGTSTFLMDEELGFGWGGGLYMTDSTYLRIRNNKTVYSTGDAWFNRLYAQQNQAYYVDPDGDSQLNTIDIDDYIRHRGDTNTYIGFAANDTFRVWTNGTQRLNIDNDSADFAVDVYGPRFIDSANNTFLIDGDGTSVLRYLNVYSGDATGELNVGRSSAQRIRQYITDGIGYIQYWQDETDTTDHSLRFEILSSSTGANTFQFNRPISMTGAGAAGYIYARRFVDADNNNYYADPAGTSVFANLTLDGGGGDAVLKFGPGVPANDDAHIEWKGASNGGYLRISTSDDNGTEFVQFGDYDTVNRGGAFTEWARLNRSTMYHLTEMSAPIFYDYNDRNYYGNFASTSVLNKLHIGSTASLADGTDPDISTTLIYATSKVVTPKLVFLNDASGDDNYIQHTDANNAYTIAGQEMGAYYEFVGDKLGASTANSAGLIASGIRGHYAEFLNQIRSPIFYDNDNTGYYVNPASSTRLNTIQALRYYFNHNTTYFADQASGDYGSIQVGGATNGWSGYAIENWWVFMANGVTNAGIYNDTDNEWAIQFTRNSDVQIYFNGTWEERSRSGYMEARGSYRAPIFYDSNDTAYYGNFAGGNTSTALRIGGIYDRLGFATSGDGNNNILMRAQDYSHWIWQTASNWGIFWAGNDNPYRSYFSTSNPNELVFIGNGNLRASIDLDDGNAFFGGEVYANNFNIVGTNGNISLNPAYGSGGADLVLFDFTPYSEAEVSGALQGSESLTVAASEYVERADAPFAGKAIETAAFRQFYSDYIPVTPGEDIYGEISVQYVSGSNGLLYYGVERFDKDKRPIASNTGTTYFVASAVNYTSTGWTTYRNHTTVPTSHTPYNGSDGGGVHYVRIRILMNYPSGGALRRFGGIMLKRRNAESNLLADDIQALDRIDAGGIIQSAASVRAPIFYDTNNTAYYLNPADATTSANLNGDVYVRSGKIQVQAGSDSFTTYVEDDSTAAGRAQLLLQSSYSDLVIMSRQANTNRHGSTLTLATQSTSTSDYAKWVVGQGQYEEGANQLAFAYGTNQTNPHNVLGTDNANYRFLIDNSGHTYSAGSSRAPIFYDLNDTNYYVNPNVNSILHNVEVRNYGIRLARNYTHNGIWFNGGTDTNHVLWNDYYGGPAARGAAGSGFDGILWNTYRGIQIRGGSAGAYNLIRATNSSGNANDHYVQLYAANVEQLGTRSGYGLAPNQMRSPIYYDYTDTAWYANPDGTSMLNIVTTNQLNMRDVGDFVTFYGNDNNYHSISSRNQNGSASDDLRFNSYNNIFFNLDSNNNNGTSGFYIGQHGAGTGTIGSQWTFQSISDGNTYASSSFRAPIFYDTNNTAYYVDPTGNTNLTRLSFYSKRNWESTEQNDSGHLNLGWRVMTHGRKVYPDEEFSDGTNGTNIYNNAGGSALTRARISDASAPNESKIIYRYTRTTGSNGTSPGYGGFYFAIGTTRNRTIVCKWRAKMDVGRQFNFASNAYGSNASAHWLTDQVGTGKWEEYAFVVRCGDSGSFSSTMFFYVTGGSATGTLFDLAAATCYIDTDHERQEARRYFASNSMYSPIYYDSNDAAYYLDPASTGTSLNVRGEIRNPSVWINDGDNVNSYNENIRLFNASNGVSVIAFSASGTSGTPATSILGYSDRLEMRRSNDWQIRMYSNSTQFRGDIRPTIMYDRNDTNWYVDPNGTSRLNNLTVEGTLTSNGIFYVDDVTQYWQTSITGLTNAPISTRNRDYNVGTTSRYLPLTHQTALYSSGYRTHLNTGLYKFANGWGDGGTGWYAAIGGNDSYPTQAWYLTYGGYIQNSLGYVRTSGSFRAPIFYDQNDTARYLDPASTSRLQRVEFYGRTIFYGREADSVGSSSYITGTQVDDYLNNVAAEFHSGNDQPVTLYFRSGVNAPSDFGYITFDPDYDNSGEQAAMVIGVNNDANDYIRLQGMTWVDSDLFSADNTEIMRWLYQGSTYGILNTDYMYHVSDMRSPIFYDSNNTGYYVDPASTSQLHYVLANNWFRPQGNTGVYFQDYGKGLWAPESGGNAYGNVTTYGSGRNGWQGWGIGSRHVFMSTGGDNVGIHDNSRGWLMYWNGSYMRFQYGYTRMDGSARSPIFYDLNDTGYYADPASTTRLNRLYINQRNDNYNVGSLNGTNNQSNWQNLTNVNGQWTVTQYNAIQNYSNSPPGVYTYGAVMSWRTANHSFQLYAAHTGDLAYKTQWNNDNYSGWLTPVVYGRNAGSASGKTIYSNIMYDTDNTAYFVDPNGRSRLSSMDYGNGSYYLAGGDWGYRHNTPYGWIQFGPANTSHAHIYTDRSNFYFNVNEMYMNGRFVLNENYWINNKYFGSGGEIYTTIIYDSNDSAFRWDGTGTNSSRFRGVHNETMAYMALSGQTRSSTQYYQARPRITSDQNYWTGSMGWGTVNMNTVADWGSGFIDSWSNPANQPAGTSHWTGIQAYHYTNGSARYGWQLVGGPISGLWFRKTWSTFGGWQKVAMYGQNEYSGDFYASRYYDSNNTGYYADPASTSEMVHLGLQGYLHVSKNNTTGQGIILADDGDIVDNNDGYAALRFSNGIYVTNGNRAGSYGSWRHILHSDGNSYARTSSRAPIFYDNNNTGYYFDGASTSRWNESNQNGYHTFNNYGLGVTGTYTSTRLQLVFAMGSSYRPNSAGTSTANMYGIGWSHPNAGSLGGANQLNDHGMLIINNGSFRAAISSRAVFSSDVRTPIYYDWNDTGYYLDPNSTSNSALRIRGGALHGPNPTWGSYLAVGTNGHWSSSYASVATTNGNLHLDSAGSRDTYIQWYIGRTVYISGAVQPTIMYDRNDTFYQSDPNGLTRVVYIDTRGSTYNTFRTWTDVPGFHGIYSSSQNGAHIYPNPSSYGAWLVLGSRNGWGGMEFRHGNNSGQTTLMMNSDTYGFHWNGVGWRFYNTGGSGYFPGNVVAYWSDRRLKENIKPLEKGEGLELITKFVPSRFNWKQEANEVTGGVIEAGKEEVSIIAQEAQEVLDDAVVINKTAKKGVVIDGEKIDDYLTINYDKITPFLIQAIKDLKDEIDDLKQEIKTLKGEDR